MRQNLTVLVIRLDDAVESHALLELVGLADAVGVWVLAPLDAVLQAGKLPIATRPGREPLQRGYFT